MKWMYSMLILVLVGCHHDDDDSPEITSPDSPTVDTETPPEETPFSFAHNACNTSSFFFSLAEADDAGLPGDRSAYVGTYYCPLSLDDAQGFGFSDYSGTTNDNSTTLVTMTSTQALSFCSQAYESGRVAIEVVIMGAASTQPETPIAPDSVVLSPYNWPQNSIYIALSFFDLIEYTIFDLAANDDGFDSAQFAASTDVGIVVCFVPE